MNFDWKSLKSSINKIVNEIQEKAGKCNPLLLMGRCNKVAAQEFLMPCPDDKKWILNDVGMLRAVEYLQSILVASNIAFDPDESLDAQEERITDVLESVSNLYKISLPLSLMVDKMLKEMNCELEGSNWQSLSTAVNMYSVRGRRDASFMKEVFDALIIPHNDVIKQEFGINAGDVIEGVLRLQDASRLSLIRLYSQLSADGWDLRFHDIDHSPSIEEINTLFQVPKIVDWPEQLVNLLTLDVNSNPVFLEGYFPGWTIKDSPIKDHPFIRIDGNVYVFGYYLLCDFFYRSFQKVIKGINPRYKWKDVQCKATEQSVAAIFTAILPSCKIYENNYYPDPLHSGQWCENDILIEYADAIIIIEVKAGRFGHESPIESYQYVLRNYNNLKDAIHQVRRTERFLLSNSDVVLCDSNHMAKLCLDLTSTKVCFKICVTLDNVNEFASCAKSLDDILGVESSGVMCVSLDDLYVLKDYFNGHPSLFLAYLKTRIDITSIPQVANWDELDLLSAFIGDINIVQRITDAIAQGFTFVNPGSYEELSDYFNHRNNPTLVFEKPWPKLSEFLLDILSFCDRRRYGHVVEFLSYILELSKDTKCKIQEIYFEEKVRQYSGRKPITHTFTMGDEALFLLILFNGVPFKFTPEWVEKKIREEGKRLRLRSARFLGFVYHGMLDEILCYRYMF